MAKKTHILWDETAGVAENARAQLPPVAAAYFRAGRKLTEGSPSQGLHAFRLKTKRLRYTLELFRTCYGPSLEQRLEALRGVQTLLGLINDCAAALRIAAKSGAPNSPQYRKLERFLQARSAKLIAEFCTHWREKFDAPGQEDWWVGYLGRARR